jgi:UDP-N-acetylglucosamine/UDP-N-acetylgalactosamine diphosphorylase
MNSPAKDQPILTDVLKSMGQIQLIDHWQTLSLTEQENLCQQVAALDVDFFYRQRAALSQEKMACSYKPFLNCSSAGNMNDSLLGKKRVAEGKVGLIVLAGGQGSRFRSTAPKGCVEITPVKKKSLFQFLAEKVKAAGKDVGRPLRMALMTSPLNHDETLLFFKEHAFFGLHPSQIDFFCQTLWPLLDFEGNLFLEEADRIAQGPNGNGDLFRRFMESGIWHQWEALGIEQVNIIPIDNPLADPFDYEFCGFQAREDADIAIKTGWKRNSEEKVGVVAEVDGKAAIIEYFEMSEDDKKRRNEDGRLTYGMANLGLYCVTMKWIKQLSIQHLPLHCAKKAVKYWAKGGVKMADKPNAWKFEEFIFDSFPFASTFAVLICPREECFAPLKNFEGEDSIEAVREALLVHDRSIFQKITGSHVPPRTQFELAPQFYYPTAELKKKWKGRPFPQEEYIHD